MERLGMGYEQIRGLKPDLIYCHSSGYGNSGEWSRLPAFEPLHSALAGLLTRTGGPGRPPLHYLTHMDFGCALTSATAVLAALWHRDRTGEGQYLECPQIGSALLAMADVHLEGGEVRESFGIDPDQRGHAATNALYRCRDGWLTISTSCQRDWVALHTALDPAAGVPHSAPVEIAGEADIMATAFGRAGGIETSSHPDYGRVFTVGDTLHFAGVARSRRDPIARLGQDTETILVEMGYDEQQRAELFAGGVVRGDRATA
jgi:crotonobetainyl-CoA:carnitine CoA-transferase CaiB-like acyl-CoA transferase